MLKPILCQSRQWLLWALPRVVGSTVSSAGSTRAQALGFSTTPNYQKKARSRGVYLKGVQSIILHHYNDLKTSEANTFVSRNPKLKSLDKHQFDAVLSLLKSRDYSWGDIREHKDVLTLMPSQLSDRLKFLEEFSIPRPKLHELVYAQAYMHSTVGFLRKYGVYSQDFDIVRHLLENIKPLELPETFTNAFQMQYKNGLDEVQLSELYFQILEKYLSLRFPSDSEAVEILFKSDWSPAWKPLVSYRDICDIVIDKLGLDFSYVMSNTCILKIDPLNVNKLLEKYPKLGGVSTKEVSISEPELLLIPFTKIERWMKILRKYKVSKFKFSIDTLRFFRSSDYTEVEERLKVLSQLPEWKIISLSDQLFGILRKPYGLKRLLDAMHSGQVFTNLSSAAQDPCGSVPVQRARRLPQEVAAYMAQELNIEEYEANELLDTEVRTHFGISNTRMVLELLLNFGFTREQVLNGIQLLNFQYGVVDEGLKLFPSRPEAQPFDQWMENPHVLHLLAYCIKKDAPHLRLSTER
ncbi:transcription termination factor 5, mitochondrial-like isoform X2 [Penaeus japonicus]|uniref:transcription termination factor 5, mitochondrial-like isoform X2 n=1 Tax=Penaeus japonicus TaxID=27405 RepID=UPI001C71759E|nr:transcription termination factor 5, mitochondrial-like isoform X2 [Penaeus japonicus]